MKKEDIELPRVPEALVHHLEDFLTTTYGSKRPPIIQAKLLALVVTLAGEAPPLPFPSRRQAAEFAGCSIYTVDTSIAALLSRGLLTKEVETRDGNIQRREGILQDWYYKPTKRLVTSLHPASAARVSSAGAHRVSR